jgi:hypothetical protein
MQHTMDHAPGIRQITPLADRSGSGNLDKCVTHADVLHGGEASSSRKQEQTKEHVVMDGLCSCNVLSEVHINGRCVSDPVREDKGKAASTG